GIDVGAEGSVGLITYMRTDATRVAEEAQREAQQFIDQQYGREYRPEQPPRYRSRAGAQAAHEAIRPTSVHRTPDTVKPFLRRDQYRLYKLIWERFLASQMAPAVLDTLTVDVAGGRYLFRATGSSVRFPGFMIVYTEGVDEAGAGKGPASGADPEEQELSGDFAAGQAVDVVKLEPKQHFTQPPPRFTEAMLVKTLEEQGIGRPSTYAQIIDTIVRRGYVTLEDRRFRPTELGFIIVDLLKEHFAPVIDVEFTARMDEALDRIEEGEVHWVQVVREFYEPFSAALARAQKEMQEVELADAVTDEVCPQCGRNLVIKWGRFGKFLACPGYPECKYTQPLLQDTGV